MARQLKAGDRVRLIHPPTYLGKWGTNYSGPIEGIGGMGTVFADAGPNDVTVDIQWDNPSGALGEACGMDVSCLTDLPWSLDREEVEAWLASP